MTVVIRIGQGQQTTDQARKELLESLNGLIESDSEVEIIDQQGVTPLMLAATKGNLEIVKLLLAKGADITKTSKEGKTALNYAMANGHIKITTILTEKQEELEANKKP